MQHVSRDNLRHLTGLGRYYADLLEDILDNPMDRFLDDSVPHPRTKEVLSRCMLSVRVNPTNGFVGVELRYVPCENRSTLSAATGSKGSRVQCLQFVIGPDSHLEIFEIPLAIVLSTTPDISKWYHIYKHEFMFDADGNGIPNSSYVGMTKRGWRTRWAEHNRAADSGSHYRFHKAIRQWRGVATGVKHAIVAMAASEGAAMSLEEHLVETETLYPLGLNMVPGGNKGLAYLRQIGVIGKNERVAPDDRQDAINRYFERASRKGLPNLLAAANWLDPHYAESVMCAAEDRLKPQQIRDARFLASLGQSVDAISVSIGARNVTQVRRLLSGDTYSRIA